MRGYLFHLHREELQHVLRPPREFQGIAVQTWTPEQGCRRAPWARHPGMVLPRGQRSGHIGTTWAVLDSKKGVILWSDVNYFNNSDLMWIILTILFKKRDFRAAAAWRLLWGASHATMPLLRTRRPTPPPTKSMDSRFKKMVIVWRFIWCDKHLLYKINDSFIL